MKRHWQNDKNFLLVLASLAVILLGLVSYYFSLNNPRREILIDKQLDDLEKQYIPTLK